MDNLTQEQCKYNMSRIRAVDTKPEVLLRKVLWRKGWRYRENYTVLPGTPDKQLKVQTKAPSGSSNNI